MPNQRPTSLTPTLRHASIASQLTVMHATYQKQSYAVTELTQALGITAKALSSGLRMLGWTRSQFWGRTEDGRRRLKVSWTPHGQQPLKPRRGRPPHDIDFMIWRMIN